jgi:hypothetical protein
MCSASWRAIRLIDADIQHSLDGPAQVAPPAVRRRISERLALLLRSQL